jgi:phage terminase small subunit
MYKTNLWNDTDKGNLKYLETYCPSSTLYAKNSTRTVAGHVAMRVDQLSRGTTRHPDYSYEYQNVCDVLINVHKVKVTSLKTFLTVYCFYYEILSSFYHA